MMLAEDFKIGHPKTRSRCHVHEFAAELYTEMECKLVQEGEERGFLDVTKPAELHVKFCIEGPLSHHFCGKICAALHVECLGGGPDITWQTQTKDITERVACTEECLEFVFNIPADAFNTPECGQVCCFIVTATSIDRCGKPGHLGCWCKLCVMLHKAPEE